MPNSGGIPDHLPNRSQGDPRPDRPGLEPFAREKRARLHAEKQAAVAIAQLEELRAEMHALLTGGVGMLTEILSLAKPELFQKASKVQRWARQLAPKLELERPWELDLAAILYPYGLIALPEDLVKRYAAGLPLSSQERRLVDESPRAGAEIVAKIPRMKTVADAIHYSRKGYDGSGFPPEGAKGAAIPLPARILKVLIDLADLSTGPGHTRAAAFAKLADRPHRYDMHVFKLVYQVLILEASDAQRAECSTLVSVDQLSMGDVLGADVVDVDGQLMLAAGSELTDLCIRRLASAQRTRRLQGQVTVTRGQAG